MTRPEPEAAPHPCEIVPGDPACGLVLACDHASNFVPGDIDLGVAPAEFSRHIAYDIGAAGVTRTLAHLLGAPAVLTNFSRLIIDPNRGRADPTLVMRLSDGAIVPGNARIDEAGKAARIARFYEPFDAGIAAALGAAGAAGRQPALVTIHSFTPYWRGVPGPGTWVSSTTTTTAWPDRSSTHSPPTRPGSSSATTIPMAAACPATRSTATPLSGACATRWWRSART